MKLSARNMELLEKLNDEIKSTYERPGQELELIKVELKNDVAEVGLEIYKQWWDEVGRHKQDPGE
jgi:hypothetical protein